MRSKKRKAVFDVTLFPFMGSLHSFPHTSLTTTHWC